MFATPVPGFLSLAAVEEDCRSEDHWSIASQGLGLYVGQMAAADSCPELVSLMGSARERNEVESAGEVAEEDAE